MTGDWIAALVEGGGLVWWPVADGTAGGMQRAPGLGALPGDAHVLVAGHPDAPVITIPAKPPREIAQLNSRVHAVQAMAQTAPPARMHETAWLAGFLAAAPGFDGIVCRTGPHACHWIHVSAGEVVSFRSSASPALFAALGGAAFDPEMGAVGDAMGRPAALTADLDSAQAAGDIPRLAGLLLGADLAAMKPYWLGQRVVVSGAWAAPTGAALRAEAAEVLDAPDHDVTLAGLLALGAAL